MTQVSKHQLPTEMVEIIYAEFCLFTSLISTRSAFQEFFNDFLTTTEKIMLSKRFMIMVLLMRGQTVEHIKNTLYVSNSAVMSVSSWLKNASPTTKKALSLLDMKKDWQKFFDQIEAILDKLPPGKYRNWQQVGKEKHLRLKSRNLRDQLR
ncbi:hypothetical protein KBD75_04635 [Candidatus Woesebacteria bacterium]|nr:hypothetical protein [Candidatus Woesebacteria bacterium]